MKISDFIPTGEANAISNRELAYRAGINERGVRKLVHEARIEGEPICSSDSGYWLAENIAEVDLSLRRIYSQIKQMSKTAHNLEIVKENMLND